MKTNIYSYLDYREFLKAAFDEKKESAPHFTQNYISKICGLKSPHYFSLVIHNRRNITPATAAKFARAFEFSKKETAYFEALVLFNQSKNETDRDLYFERLIQLRPKDYLKTINQDQYEYFTKRYFVTIREMVALKNFKENDKWIANSVNPEIKPSEARHAIAVLLRLDLLKRDETGKLIHSRKTMQTDPQFESVEIYNYTRELLSEAKQGILSNPIDLTDMIAFTLPVAQKRLPEIRKILNKCKDDIIELIRKDREEFDEVFQLNLQYYPLTKASF